jgi:DNA-binding beta-propeller fold protein YncE
MNGKRVIVANGSCREMTRKALALLLPVAVAFCPTAFAQTLLIGNKGENTVSFVDLSSGRERARVATGDMPHEIAVSPNGRRAAVVAYGGTTIDIFDVRSARRLKRIDIAPNAGPHGIAWLKDGRLVATAERSQSIVLVDPRRGSVRSVMIGQAGSHMLAISPNQRFAYVSNIMAGTVSIVDLRRAAKVADIRVGGNPEGIAITPDGRQLWVGDDSGPRVRIIDIATRRTVETLLTDSIAIRIAITPDGKTAIVSNMGAGTLNLFDVATLKPSRTIRVSGDPQAVQVTIAFGRNGRTLFVAETARDTIAEVDLAGGTVLRRIAAGRQGDGLGMAP